MTRAHEERPLGRSHSLGAGRDKIETLLFRTRLARRHPPFAASLAKFAIEDFDLHQSPPRPPPPVSSVEPEHAPAVAAEPDNASLGKQRTQSTSDSSDDDSESSVVVVSLASDGTAIELPSAVSQRPEIEFSESSATESSPRPVPERLFKCTVCTTFRVTSDFARTQLTRARRGNAARCRACVADYDRLRRYGLNRSSYDALLQEQKNQCVICACDLADLPLKHVHVDHCHESGKVRGILCMECNTGIGKFRNSVTHLLTACDYLINRGIPSNVDGLTTVALSRVVIALCQSKRKHSA